MIALCIFLASSVRAWEPPPGHQQQPIWPGAAPDVLRGTGPEDEAVTVEKLVAGKPWVAVSNVVRPTMTVYSPAHDSTGAAVVVFPGGGYNILAIDLEGTEVCEWLTSKGITCVLLKYRVPGVGGYPKPAPYPKSGPYPFSPMALEDAQRTVGLVRAHAAEWHIDPHKIGVLGFSAGGHLVAAISTHYEKRLYAPVDHADEVSCRPDFAVLLYPGHLTVLNVAGDARRARNRPAPHAVSENARLELNPDIRVNRDTPPSFIVQAEDDPVDDVDNSLVYFIALQKAHVVAEMHLYAKGGHAFGLRKTNQPITDWPELFAKWLRTIQMIP